MPHNTNPMDTDNPKSSSIITMTKGYVPLGELGLIGFTPSKANKVASMNCFIFDKESRKIIQQSMETLVISGIS
jgi:hypothetical protein